MYGSTTVSETFGDGTIENVDKIRSGYSSRSFVKSKVPIPEPVPPPSEWTNSNPYIQSQDSASFLTTSIIASIISAPSL